MCNNREDDRMCLILQELVELNNGKIRTNEELSVVAEKISGIIDKTSPQYLYVVKSSFGGYEDSVESIEGVFSSKEQANKCKDDICNDIKRVKEFHDSLDFDDPIVYRKYERLYDFFNYINSYNETNIKKIRTYDVENSVYNELLVPRELSDEEIKEILENEE